jgi:hypothetical protein
VAASIAEYFTIYAQVGWLDDDREGTSVLAPTTSPGESVLGSIIPSCWTLLDLFDLFSWFFLGSLSSSSSFFFFFLLMY